nr:MAG TPA: hypothetical protein [Caudoviricetes sp.]
MGFLPQFYVIKDAMLNPDGLTINSEQIATASPIIAINGKSYNNIYSNRTQTIVNTNLSNSSMFLFSSNGITTISNSYPFCLYLSEDSDEDKLVISKLDHVVPKGTTNVSKLFENGKNYCVITYTNSEAAFNIATIRIAVNINTGGNTASPFMIYSESIDPITIGTGETVQIKIEV